MLRYIFGAFEDIGVLADQNPFAVSTLGFTFGDGHA
jgi:hypothetical protein